MRTPWLAKPASGGKGAGGPASDGKGEGKPANVDNTFFLFDAAKRGHYELLATVIGLPELFQRFGHMATARELYEWWGHARVLVHKRVHGASNPPRREAARRRHRETGRWGWGPGQ